MTCVSRGLLPWRKAGLSHGALRLARSVPSHQRDKTMTTTDDFDATLTEDEISLEKVQQLARDGKRVHLSCCTGDAADLSGLDLKGWHFDRCKLARTRFDGSSFERATFTACKAPFASFAGANLSEATITGGDFSNTTFRRSSLAHARFSRCKLMGADLQDAKTWGLSLEEAVLTLAKLAKVSFRKLALHRIDFSEAQLLDCDFRETVFEECSLRDAVLVNCRFERADLRGADLGGIGLADAKAFRGAIISKAQAAVLVRELGLDVV